MKRTIFLSLIIALIIGSCAKEKKAPLEGAWKMVYAKWTFSDFTLLRLREAKLKFGLKDTLVLQVILSWIQ